MSLTHFDWSIFIAELNEVPEDVIFQIVEDGEDGKDGKDGKDGEDGELHEIKAHKMVLGIVSPTFKAMFYTTEIGDKATKKIKIEASTKQAFQIIIDDLYKIKSIQNSLEGKSLQEIFDVVNLIEKYQMAKLQEAINELLSNFPITDDTVLEVAAEAIHQSRLFQKEAHHLLITCAKFLKPKLKDVNTIFKYVEENEDQKEVVAALLARMNGISISPTECSNCGYEDCQEGKPVREGEFREGLLVTNNPAANYWGRSDYGTGEVRRVGATYVTVEHIKSGLTQNGFHASQFDGSYWLKNYDGYNLFLFACN